MWVDSGAPSSSWRSARTSVAMAETLLGDVLRSLGLGPVPWTNRNGPVSSSSGLVLPLVTL